jgi:hypothetical protein
MPSKTHLSTVSTIRGRRATPTHEIAMASRCALPSDTTQCQHDRADTPRISILLTRKIGSTIRTRLCLAVRLATLTFVGSSNAIAQALPVPGISAPPFPLPPPSPQIQVPAIPQIGVTPPPNLAPLPQNSFSDRVTQCLQTGAAGGLTAGSLSAYTGECANQ